MGWRIGVKAMPKVAKELSAAEVRRIDRPGFHPVGGVPGLLSEGNPGQALVDAKTKARRANVCLK